MDRIVRDVSAAGLGVHPWAQIFTNGLNAAGPRESEPRTPTLTDALEVLTDESGNPAQEVCESAPGASPPTVRLKDGVSPARVGQVVLVFLQNGKWTARQITAITLMPAGGACGANSHLELTFSGSSAPAGSAQAAFNTAGLCTGGVGDTDADAGCLVSTVSFGSAVGYRIFPDVPLDAPVFLERRSTSNTPDGAAGNAWNNAWQQIAPGIEDLQVLYWNWGLGVPSPSAATPALLTSPGPLLLATPNAPTAAEVNSRIRQVQVMISARTTAENLPGMSDPKARGRGYVRGQLVSTVVVPATLDILSRGTATSVPPVQFR
jgi:hypothetical protein